MASTAREIACCMAQPPNGVGRKGGTPSCHDLGNHYGKVFHGACPFERVRALSHILVSGTGFSVRTGVLCRCSTHILDKAIVQGEKCNHPENLKAYPFGPVKRVILWGGLCIARFFSMGKSGRSTTAETTMPPRDSGRHCVRTAQDGSWCGLRGFG